MLSFLVVFRSGELCRQPLYEKGQQQKVEEPEKVEYVSALFIWTSLQGGSFWTVILLANGSVQI